MSEPKFKVGDKVVVVDYDDLYHNLTHYNGIKLTIIENYKSKFCKDIFYKLKNDKGVEYGFYEKYLKLDEESIKNNIEKLLDLLWDARNFDCIIYTFHDEYPSHIDENGNIVIISTFTHVDEDDVYYKVEWKMQTMSTTTDKEDNFKKPISFNKLTMGVVNTENLLKG